MYPAYYPIFIHQSLFTSTATVGSVLNHARTQCKTASDSATASLSDVRWGAAAINDSMARSTEEDVISDKRSD